MTKLTDLTTGSIQDADKLLFVDDSETNLNLKEKLITWSSLKSSISNLDLFKSFHATFLYLIDNGSVETAVKGDPVLSYQEVSEAVADYSSGDTVVVQGTVTIDDELTKDGSTINYILSDKNVVLDCASTSLAYFTDGNISDTKIYVDGPGAFTHTGGGTIKCINLDSTSSYLSLKCSTFEAHGGAKLDCGYYIEVDNITLGTADDGFITEGTTIAGKTCEIVNTKISATQIPTEQIIDITGAADYHYKNLTISDTTGTAAAVGIEVNSFGTLILEDVRIDMNHADASCLKATNTTDITIEIRGECEFNRAIVYSTGKVTFTGSGTLIADGKVVYSPTVDDINAYHVFMPQGQSNAKGQNDIADLADYTRYNQTFDGVKVWNGSSIETLQSSDLNNNQFPDVDSSVSHSVSLAIDYHISTGRKVIIFPFAIGGTPLYDTGSTTTWNINSTSPSALWDRYEDQVTLFKAYLADNNIPHEFKAAIIDQGEGDASQSVRANEYETNYGEWVDALRGLFGSINIYKVLQYFDNTTYSYTSTVRTAEIAVEAANSFVTSIEKDGWPSIGDDVHADVYGQMALGSEIAMLETGDFLHHDNFIGTTLDPFWTETNTNPTKVSIEVDNKLKFTKLANSSSNWEDRVLSTTGYSGTLVMSAWIYRTSPGVSNEPNGGFGLYYDDDNYLFIGFNNTSGSAGDVRVILRATGTTQINSSVAVSDQKLFRVSYSDETTIATFQYNDPADGAWKELVPSEAWDISVNKTLTGKFGFFMAAQNTGGTEFNFRKVTCGRKRYTSIFPS